MSLTELKTKLRWETANIIKKRNMAVISQVEVLDGWERFKKGDTFIHMLIDFNDRTAEGVNVKNNYRTTCDHF